MSKNDTIIINGQAYDTRTGSALSTAIPHAPHHSEQPVGQYVKKQTSDHTDPQMTTPKPATLQRTIKPATRPARHVARHAAPHTPIHSQTLMRQAVKKPAVSLKRRVKAQGHLSSLSRKPLSIVTVKSSVTALNANHLRHAGSTPQSQAVSHFSARQFSNSSNGGAQLPNILSDALAQTTEFTPQPAGRPQPTALRPSRSSQRRKPRTTAELLEYALQQATSHEQLPPKRAKRSHSPWRRTARSFSAS